MQSNGFLVEDLGFCKWASPELEAHDEATIKNKLELAILLLKKYNLMFFQEIYQKLYINQHLRSDHFPKYFWAALR